MNTTLLDQLISINSVYPNEKQHAEFLEEQLKKIGFTTRRQIVSQDRFNILAERGNKNSPDQKALCFFGHIDTVPPYGEWNTDPFKAHYQDGKIYGLGAVDMKGGVFAILEACRETDPQKYLKVIFCVDEENISAGAWKAVTDEEFFNDVKTLIAAETGNIHPYDPQEKWVHLGRRGRCTIDLEVLGLSAHGAFPEKGINAINDAATIINSLKTLPLSEHPIIGKSSLFANNITSTETSLSIPDYCKFEINRSLVPPETPESALKQVQEMVQKLQTDQHLKSQINISLQKRDTPFAPPYITDKENPTIQHILKIIGEETPKVSIDYGLSVADENVFANGAHLAVISVGPEGDNEHTANEWVNIDSLKRLVNYFKRFIEEV
ncbi:hypothetical protein CVV38_02135 [Candidatus Peregrinibacteria bacterium HGW-Peregrinibacteria-1]|jgi:acetylornithine deacetylase/succinyl-diaminopimelate desuccinylase-like protein|nr:MAG: hypothetical protein CVV38_02135 [Candidatus Peregrinibacteria bacterium HGW-Peregrinibacteria-1]